MRCKNVIGAAASMINQDDYLFKVRILLDIAKTRVVNIYAAVCYIIEAHIQTYTFLES